MQHKSIRIIDLNQFFEMIWKTVAHDAPGMDAFQFMKPAMKGFVFAGTDTLEVISAMPVPVKIFLNNNMLKNML